MREMYSFTSFIIVSALVYCNKKADRLRGSAQSVENLRVVKGPQPLEAKPEKKLEEVALSHFFESLTPR